MNRGENNDKKKKKNKFLLKVKKVKQNIMTHHKNMKRKKQIVKNLFYIKKDIFLQKRKRKTTFKRGIGQIFRKKKIYKI